MALYAQLFSTVECKWPRWRQGNQRYRMPVYERIYCCVLIVYIPFRPCIDGHLTPDHPQLECLSSGSWDQWLAEHFRTCGLSLYSPFPVHVGTQFPTNTLPLYLKIEVCFQMEWWEGIVDQSIKSSIGFYCLRLCGQLDAVADLQQEGPALT